MKNIYIIAGSMIILSGLGVITFNQEVFSPNKEARALLTQGQLLLEQNSPDTQKDAMEIFTTIASRFPDTNQSKEALYHLAELYEKWGNIDVAINKYRGLLGINLPKDLSDKVKFKIARLQLSRYNATEGFNALMVLLSENVDDLLRSDIYTEIARYYARQKNLANSQSNYEIAISENPKNKDADLELASVLFAQKKYSDALRQYEHFFNIYINRSERNEEIAKIFQERMMDSATEIFHDGDMENAANYFNFIKEKFPLTKYSELSHYYLGNLEYRQGNYPKAIQEFDSVIKYAPTDKDENAYLKKGQCYYQLHEFTKASLYFSKMQDLFPDGKYGKLAKKWERESRMALREKLELETIRENNDSDHINGKSSSRDIEDFFGKEMPEELDTVAP